MRGIFLLVSYLLWAGVLCLPISDRSPGGLLKTNGAGRGGHARGKAERKGLQVAADEAISLSEDIGVKGFRTFVDEHGRERVFHGVNAVVKGPPWLPSNGKFDVNTSLGAEDFLFLQKHGVNVIRLGLMWAGAEPERGVYNETYLKMAKDMAAMAAQYGIYTLLDMHQDVMSDKFCGEGVPAWAAQPSGLLSFPEPIAPAFFDVDPKNGFPTQTDCLKHGWPDYYFTEATSTAFQNLYDNKDGLLDAWGAFWAKVAKTFLGDKHILGLELINEPWAGDVIHDPILMAPGVADKRNLQPAYDVLNKYIRAVNPSALVFFAGVTWGHTGFTQVPGGHAYTNRSVLAYHHYELPAGPKLKNTSFSDLNERAEDGKRLQCGLFMTEFSEAGGCNGDIWDTLTSEADRHAQSWASWEYKTFCTDDGGISQWSSFGSCRTGWGGGLWNQNASGTISMRKALARTYAQAVSGDIITSRFDAATSVFVLQFVPKLETLTPTELYMSDELHYPSGATIIIEPKGAATAVRRKNGATVVLTPIAALEKKITLTVKPL